MTVSGNQTWIKTCISLSVRIEARRDAIELAVLLMEVSEAPVMCIRCQVWGWHQWDVESGLSEDEVVFIWNLEVLRHVLGLIRASAYKFSLGMFRTLWVISLPLCDSLWLQFQQRSHRLLPFIQDVDGAFDLGVSIYFLKHPGLLKDGWKSTVDIAVGTDLPVFEHVDGSLPMGLL